MQVRGGVGGPWDFSVRPNKHFEEFSEAAQVKDLKKYKLKEVLNFPFDSSDWNVQGTDSTSKRNVQGTDRNITLME